MQNHNLSRIKLQMAHLPIIIATECTAYLVPHGRTVAGGCSRVHVGLVMHYGEVRAELIAPLCLSSPLHNT